MAYGTLEPIIGTISTFGKRHNMFETWAITNILQVEKH